MHYFAEPPADFLVLVFKTISKSVDNDQKNQFIIYQIGISTKISLKALFVHLKDQSRYVICICHDVLMGSMMLIPFKCP